MRHLCSLCCCLMGFWLLLSGHYTPLFTGFAIFSVALVAWLSWRLKSVDEEAQPLAILPRLPRYLLWLAWELVKTNLDVTRRIWSWNLDISPTLICFRCNPKTAVGKTIYGNSITVTPGTVCINVKDDEMEVHALTWSAAKGLLEGEMDRRVCQLEK